MTEVPEIKITMPSMDPIHLAVEKLNEHYRQARLERLILRIRLATSSYNLVKTIRNWNK